MTYQNAKIDGKKYHIKFKPRILFRFAESNKKKSLIDPRKKDKKEDQ